MKDSIKKYFMKLYKSFDNNHYQRIRYEKHIENIPIRLYISFFISQDKERQKEYEECILKNSFLEQHILVENETSSKWIKENNPNAIIHYVTKRPTYQDFFDLSENGYINILANTDILFDKSIYYINGLSLDKRVVCLSRWERHTEENIFPYIDPASQDVWIWNGKINIKDCNFYLGIPGCDNRIAYEFDKAGYNLINPQSDIITVHNHATSIRNTIDMIDPPYKLIQHSIIEYDRLHIDRNIVPFKKVNNILHVGYPMSGLQTAFKNNSNNYYFIHRDSKTLQDEIIEYSVINRPNIIFCQIQGPDILKKETLNKVRKYCPLIINWTGDARRPIPLWYKEYGKLFDITLFSNETDVTEMKMLNFSSDFWNIGFEVQLYQPLGTKLLKHDIVFLGNNYNNVFPLSGLRKDMVTILKLKYRKQFGIYGSGWENADGYADENTESCLYRGSKMAISLSHYDLDRYFSDRMLRIMGCSTLCLAKWYPGIEKDFIDGFHLVVWKNIPELIEKIDYFLLHDDEARKISRQGCILVHEYHNWNFRLNELQYVLETNTLKRDNTYISNKKIKWLRTH
jgi:hypothetical protein